MIPQEDFNKLLEKYPNLRLVKKGSNSKNNLWTIENIKEGLLYFFDTHGRYPTSKEIDNFEFLVSSRQLQRSFGGVVEIRKQLNLKGAKDYTKGRARSLVAGLADERAKKYEEEFYDFLISKVDEIKVHEHKVIRPGNVSSDFFIYTSNNSGIVIDLFYAADLHSFKGVINIKTKTYSSIKSPVYFVLVGDSPVSQKQIEESLLNKKNLLPTNIFVVTENYFKEKVDQIIVESKSSEKNWETKIK